MSQIQRTLKDNYAEKQKLIVKKKAALIESRWDSADLLILEAFDKQQMTAAIDVVKRLKSINFASMDILSKARDAAVADVTKVLSGGKNTGVIRTIINLFKTQKENPLVDALAFADALKNFFDLFNKYIDALNTGNDNNATLLAVITGNSQASDVNSLSNDEKKKLDDLQKVIIKGFKPTGAIAMVGKNWVDKYMHGSQGLKSLASSIIKMSVKDVEVITNSVIKALQNVDAVSDAAAGAAQQSTNTTAPSQGGDQPTSSEPATSGTTTKSGAEAPEAAPVEAGKLKDLVQKYSKVPSLKGIKPRDIARIIKQLSDDGQIKLPTLASVMTN